MNPMGGFMTDRSQVVTGFSLLTDHDIYLFREGNHFQLYDKLGAHIVEVDGVRGTFFAVWAPCAAKVSVVGDFNKWNPQTHPLSARWDGSGIWEGFIPRLGKGSLYKYHIVSNNHHYAVKKGDPFAFFWEMPPQTASVVWDLDYDWADDQWRGKKNGHKAPTTPGRH